MRNSKINASTFPGDPLFLDHLMKGDRGVLDACNPKKLMPQRLRLPGRENLRKADSYASLFVITTRLVPAGRHGTRPISPQPWRA